VAKRKAFLYRKIFSIRRRQSEPLTIGFGEAATTELDTIHNTLHIMRTMQTKRKAVGGPPPHKQSASLLLRDELDVKDKEIAVLKESLWGNARKIARLEDTLASKDREIAALENGKKLDYYNAGLNDSDLVMAGIRYTVKKVENLKLGHNNITFSDGKLVDAIFSNNTNLKELSLHNNKISTEGMKNLTNALKKNTTLEVLYLGDNNIDDEGAKYLADMLIDNRSLQVIGLGPNNITDKGAHSIAASLVVNTSVRKLLLFDNEIGDKGAETLMDAVASNHSIKSLCLSQCKNLSDQCNRDLLDILSDPKRKYADQTSSLEQVENYIAAKDEEVSKKDAIIYEEVAEKNKAIAKVLGIIAKRGEEIDMLKDSMKNSKSIETVDLTSGDENEQEIAMLSAKNNELEKAITTKNEEIASLKKSLKNSKPINVVDLVDTTTSKHARTEEDTPKSNLAIQHEQNQKIVQVKEEKVAAETALKDVREDLEDYQEDMGRQVLFTDFLQSKIDELAALAEVGGVDRAQVAEIKGRSYSSMSS